MVKKKSCQNHRVPRVLSVAERELYGWVDGEILTQPSVVEADMLPELRREMRLTVDRVAEGYFVLEVAGPSDRVSEGSPVTVAGGGYCMLLPRKGFYVLPRLPRHTLPWVYWNAEVGDYRITALDPLETLAFDFLQSLLARMGKKSNFKCRWILDHSDTDVGVFLDSLLKDMEKQSRFDRLMQKMKEAEGVGPRSILPSSKAPTAAFGASSSVPVTPA
ncbi:hypothetical protein PIB30_084082 [Stylosanthes scabra]|uniref:Uncharacterized protein n=1 Tax=Stylosanthes scabra TaxID=79078 RepID=A0ABU6WTM2_9FABA|nr:hypothetical protein [Stylosanthes scabra]